MDILEDLTDLAGSALQREDSRVPKGVGQHLGEARSLKIIFDSWSAAGYHVDSEVEYTEVFEGRQRKRRTDAIVTKGDFRAAIEAKWWCDGWNHVIRADAEKLIRRYPSCRKVIMLLCGFDHPNAWSKVGEWIHDLNLPGFNGTVWHGCFQGSTHCPRRQYEKYIYVVTLEVGATLPTAPAPVGEWTPEEEAELKRLQLRQLQRQAQTRQMAVQAWDAVKPHLPKIAFGIFIIWLSRKHPQIFVAILFTILLVLGLMIKVAGLVFDLIWIHSAPVGG